MIVIVSNAEPIGDKHRNLLSIRAFFEYYKIEHTVCYTIHDMTSLDKSIIKGIVLSGSSALFDEGAFYKQIRKNVYAITEWQRPNIIPIYGMCFSCQFMVLTYGGDIKNKYKLFDSDSRNVPDFNLVNLNTSFDIYKNMPIRESQKVEAFFNDVPLIENSHFSNEFHITSRTVDRDVPVSFKHKTHPWYFSMFHPDFLEETHPILFTFVKDICGVEYTLPTKTNLFTSFLETFSEKELRLIDKEETSEAIKNLEDKIRKDTQSLEYLYTRIELLDNDIKKAGGQRKSKKNKRKTNLYRSNTRRI